MHTNVKTYTSPFWVLVMVGILFLMSPPLSAELFGGVDFPLGEKSFADSVVSESLGPDTIDPYNKTTSAREPPDYPSNSQGYVSLGHGGNLVVRFTDNYLIDMSIGRINDLFPENQPFLPSQS